MSRWHAPGCAGGDENILVNPNGLPHCQSCKSTPDIPRLLTQQDTGLANLQVPPDEPPGQLNLSWPPTVPYSKSGQICDATRSVSSIHALFEAGTGTSTSTSADSNSHPVSAAPNTTRNEPLSPVYPEALRHDEFRLLVLDSRNTPAHADEATHDWPVHMDLETYRDNDHPEYETVSYTWGGENDDSSPSQPVYVGPCWDALLQTKNCHDMLRLLRPRRGLRFLWVDAICINQNDPDERAHQVSKMQIIYSNAWRCFVYLGSDVVTPVPNRSFYPARRRFEDLARSEEGERLVFPDLSFRQVLERRYFSRIWVIQELLLSKSICVRVRDMELLIDRPTQSDLLDDGQSSKERGGTDYWGATKAPWMAQATRGIVPDPVALLQMVRLSSASDPRDEIFGIIGLLRPSLSLIPDYSLSLLRAHVGFAGHILLNGNTPEALLHPGPRHRGQRPSWVPWPLPKDTPWRRRTPEMDSSWEGILGRFYRGLNASNSLDLLDDNYLPDGIRQGVHRSGHAANCPTWREGKYWRAGAHIDAANGSLSIRLVHLMPLRRMPVQIGREDGFTIMRLEAHSTYVWAEDAPCRWEFSLVFQDSPHGLDLRPGVDHVFILHGKSQEAGPQFIILRPLRDTPLSFRLVACCHRAFICVMRKSGLYANHYEQEQAIRGRSSLSIAGLRRDLIPFLQTSRLRNMIYNCRPHFISEDLLHRSVWLACLIYHGHKMPPAFPLDPPLGGLKLGTVMCALKTALDIALGADLEPKFLNFEGQDCIELHVLHSNMHEFDARAIVESLFQAVQERLSGPSIPEERPVPVPIPKAHFWRRGDIWTLGHEPPKVYTDIHTSPVGDVLMIVNDMLYSESRDMTSLYLLFPVEKDTRAYIQDNQKLQLKVLYHIGRDRRLETRKGPKDALSTALELMKPGASEGPVCHGEAETRPEHILAAPLWPRDLVEAFGIDGSTYQVTIT
ncbi:hypothetical protein GGTG_09058 [Gaeumannomyces tritici R3-111a-1]|uniref:Heterokaryon incompatibility domain-containing protein n=1 Tax=Gaeumannomyces tritici (strain R3-111a-1) TaxID=644352 RepID=J3P6B7_GAET3|nr:hypothetical protein GGTG_09058 [Gaeumannomyces tritici R3-111a-1]EJT72191.1 hypothetical protein GGTG_09058 [Gaeumannomyces tritici R3-111a-1]